MSKYEKTTPDNNGGSPRCREDNGQYTECWRKKWWGAIMHLILSVLLI